MSQTTTAYTTGGYDYPVTFCFNVYNPDRSWNWGAECTHRCTGKYFHCETYDHTERRGAYTERGERAFTVAMRHYGNDDIEFITVILNKEQYDRYIRFVYSKNDTALWDDRGLSCFLFACCCKCAPVESATCSEIMAEMICTIWGLSLERAYHRYSPTDMYDLLRQLEYMRYIHVSSHGINPNPKTSFFLDDNRHKK